MEKPLIIFDTDMDTDCDDAGALGLLLQYVIDGKADLLGVIANAPVAGAAPCCEAICAYYGVEVPVGAVYEVRYADAPRFDDYYECRGGLSCERRYNEELKSRVGKRDTDYAEAAEAYTRMLENAPDHSVTVVAVGMLTALAELFDSESGVELFRKKVKCVVSMGNASFPEHQQENFNYKMDRVGAKIFFERCPVSVYVCPDGSDVILGQDFAARFPAEHPVRVAYERWCGEGNGRPSWDLVSVLFALEPQSPLYCAKTHGTVRYDTSNRTYWERGERTDYDLRVTVPADRMAAVLAEKLAGENR